MTERIIDNARLIYYLFHNIMLFCNLGFELHYRFGSCLDNSKADEANAFQSTYLLIW